MTTTPRQPTDAAQAGPIDLPCGWYLDVRARGETTFLRAPDGAKMGAFEPREAAAWIALAVQPEREPAVPEELRRAFYVWKDTPPFNDSEYSSARDDFHRKCGDWVRSLLSASPQPDPQDGKP